MLPLFYTETVLQQQDWKQRPLSGSQLAIPSLVIETKYNYTEEEQTASHPYISAHQCACPTDGFVTATDCLSTTSASTSKADNVADVYSLVL